MHIDLKSNSIDGTITSLTDLARHPELWFDDGSVILIAEAMSFRVHRSILYKHSSVFSDIFGIPQPPDSSSETIEGCPVIRMHDSAREFAQLLKACYDPSFFPQETSTISIGYALSILRLSTKYHMPNFRSRSLDELKRHFPSESLAVFDDHYKDWPAIRQITSLQDIIRAITIAREAVAFDLLPCAFAMLCNVSLERAFFVEASPFLEREDFQRIAIGRENMRIAAEDQIFAFVLSGQVSDGCTDPTVCNKKMTAMAGTVRKLIRNCPFTLPVSGKPHTAQLYGLCPACSTQHDLEANNAREVVWNSLPEYFGLGGWQELKRSSIWRA